MNPSARLVKALLVADPGMELRAVAGCWRPLIAVYLLSVGGGIVLAFASA